VDGERCEIGARRAQKQLLMAALRFSAGAVLGLMMVDCLLFCSVMARIAHDTPESLPWVPWLDSPSAGSVGTRRPGGLRVDYRLSLLAAPLRWPARYSRPRPRRRQRQPNQLAPAWAWPSDHRAQPGKPSQLLPVV